MKSSASEFPSAAIAVIFLKSLVPKYAIAPPFPTSIFFICSLVYFPLKHISTTGKAGMVPALSGVIGPSPPRESVVSMTRPLLWTDTEEPPPRWATITVTSLLVLPMLLAYRLTTALELRAWKRVLLGNSGRPPILSSGNISSAIGGSAIYALHSGPSLWEDFRI